MSTPAAPGPHSASPDDQAERLEQLWQRHRHEGDRSARQELIATYYPLVRHVARKLASALPQRVEIGDLEGYGAEGLVDAVDRFEFGRGAQFTTFAAHRIRGAIFDGLRAADWAPRSVRRRAREINDNYSYLSIEHGRAPTEDEEADALGIGIDALRASKAKIAGADVCSLDQRVSSSDSSVGMEPPDYDVEPGAVYALKERSRALEEGVRTLSARERQVTQLSYGEGMTLAEIGRLLGVTESRVCQIRSSAIRQLREYVYEEGVGS